MPDVLWATSFADDMYEASGRFLLESFLKTKSCGDMLVGFEGKGELGLTDRRVLVTRVPSLWLDNWITKFADVVPQHLGGKSDGICRCKGGPYDPHDKRHKMPCIGHWFNRNAYRWLRKVDTQLQAVQLAKDAGYDLVVWVDSDCLFKQRVTDEQVLTWLAGQGFFFLKNKRPILEAGVFGFDLRKKGHEIIEAVGHGYMSGRFAKDERWDDSAQLQLALQMLKPRVKSIDLALKVGEHAAVVEHSCVGGFISHAKGRHGRGLGIMT